MEQHTTLKKAINCYTEVIWRLAKATLLTLAVLGLGLSVIALGALSWAIPVIYATLYCGEKARNIFSLLTAKTK